MFAYVINAIYDRTWVIGNISGRMCDPDCVVYVPDGEDEPARSPYRESG